MRLLSGSSLHIKRAERMREGATFYSRQCNSAARKNSRDNLARHYEKSTLGTIVLTTSR